MNKTDPFVFKQGDGLGVLHLSTMPPVVQAVTHRVKEADGLNSVGETVVPTGDPALRWLQSYCKEKPVLLVSGTFGKHKGEHTRLLQAALQTSLTWYDAPPHRDNKAIQSLKRAIDKAQIVVVNTQGMGHVVCEAAHKVSKAQGKDYVMVQNITLATIVQGLYRELSKRDKSANENVTMVATQEPEEEAMSYRNSNSEAIRRHHAEQKARWNDVVWLQAQSGRGCKQARTRLATLTAPQAEGEEEKPVIDQELPDRFTPSGERREGQADFEGSERLALEETEDKAYQTYHEETQALVSTPPEVCALLPLRTRLAQQQGCAKEQLAHEDAWLDNALGEYAEQRDMAILLAQDRYKQLCEEAHVTCKDRNAEHLAREKDLADKVESIDLLLSMFGVKEGA